MASSLSRRLIVTSSKLLLCQNPNLNPTARFLFHSQTLIKPFSSSPNPFQNRSSIQFLKPFSSSPNPFQSRSSIQFLKPFSSSPHPNPNPNPNPDPIGFKHQEIEGPTVDRDESALANESREVLTSLRKSIYDLSSSLALLSFVHLGLGAYIAYKFPADAVSSVQGLAAFAFPFSIAFLMRRSIKPMNFFQRMEERGRLQILTLSLQSVKSLRVLFLRIRVASVCCVVGISGGALVAMWLR